MRIALIGNPNSVMRIALIGNPNSVMRIALIGNPNSGKTTMFNALKTRPRCLPYVIVHKWGKLCSRRVSDGEFDHYFNFVKYNLKYFLLFVQSEKRSETCTFCPSSKSAMRLKVNV